MAALISLLGAILALGLLIFLAFRGGSVLLLGPLMAALAAAFAAEPLLATYTQVFMPAAGRFIVAFFPLFLLGAVFGRLMDDTGAARVIADAVVHRLGPSQAIPAVVLACALLTYGGVSLFVVAFAVCPLAMALFRRADIPKRLIPGAVALGAFTFTMTALPGTPAIQNAIPMPYFGTTPFAAPGLGLIAAAIMAGFGLWWLGRRRRSAVLSGEGYGAHDEGPPAGPETRLDRPSLALAAAPIVLVIALNYALSIHLLPGLDARYLALPRFGATDLSTVVGLWAIILSLSAAILLLLIANRRRLAAPSASLSAGAEAALLPIFNTASLVGFGAVVAALPGFDLARTGVESLGGGAVIQLAMATSVLAGLTGSASGGMSIALEALGAESLARAAAEGVSPDLLHRVAAIATGGLDSLPHNGAVVTLLGVCGLTHQQSYRDIAAVAVAGPLLALAAVIALGSVVGAV